MADDSVPEEETSPPSPTRVVRRALALASVCGRALLEQDDPSDPTVERTRVDLLRWVDDVGIRDEFEPDEATFLNAPLGGPGRQIVINSTWRFEGLGVLVWALRLADLPPHDVLVEPGVLFRALRILKGDARKLLAEPRLRTDDELGALREQMFAFHWRLRDFRLRPHAMDFAAFARTAGFGPLDITGLRLADGDLAVGELPLAAAASTEVERVTSIAQERHLAANWLGGFSRVYSETGTDT